MSTVTPTPSKVEPQRPQQEPISETTSQVQSLAQRIHAMLSAEQRKSHIVGVTSCNRREGVSVVAENLARCAAELYAGKVLLIDANIRHASVANRFGIKQERGLVDCFSEKVPLHECIVSTTHPGLSVLPAGTTKNHSMRFSDKRVSELFERLRQNFELIVIDLPPANKMDETFLASQVVDGILLAVEAERVRRQVAQRVKRQLEQVDARLLGVVLNKRKNYIPGWLYNRL